MMVCDDGDDGDDSDDNGQVMVLMTPNSTLIILMIPLFMIPLDKLVNLDI